MFCEARYSSQPVKAAVSALGTKRTSLVAPHMSAIGGKADIIQEKADIKKCPLMTQSGHSLPVGTYVKLAPVVTA